MKITKLISENVKRLKAVSITPGPHMNKISGANGSGQTSVLDSIEWVLQGTSNVPSQPVRKGAGKARIIVETEEYIVYRTFAEGGSKNGILKLESKTNRGTFHQGPQELLNSILGRISFDPLEFLRMNSKRQFDVLRGLVKLDIDLDQLDLDYQTDYMLRRDLKKEVTALETRRDGIKVPEGLPAKKHDEAALVKELREASDYNAEIEGLKRQREDIQQKQDEQTEEMHGKIVRIKALQDEIAELQNEVKESGNLLARVQREIEAWKPLPEPKNAGDLADAITAAKRINAAIDQRNFRATFEKEIAEKEKRITELSEALDRRDTQKIDAMSSAHFPVEGLAFGNEEVIYEGLPFNQVSNADQIRAAVAIGMAANPTLRVMRIKDGSLLDEDSMQMIAEMAQTQDYQVFVEVVDTSGKVGIYLEDGEVKAVNEEPEPEPKQDAPATPKKRAKKVTPIRA